MTTRQPGGQSEGRGRCTVPTGVAIRDVREQLFDAAERVLLCRYGLRRMAEPAAYPVDSDTHSPDCLEAISSEV
jgi:hypothetical protein